MIAAPSTLTVDGTNPGAGVPSQISNGSFGPAEGGNIIIRAGNVALAGDALVGSAASGAGGGGKVTIDSSGDIAIDGSLAQLTGAGVFAQTSGSGNAGSIIMNARNITLLDGGQVNAATSGSGAAGAVHLSASGMLLLDGTGQNALGALSSIVADSGTPGGGNSGLGPGGPITINAENITLRGDAFIRSYAFGDGPAGAVTLNAAASITLDGTLATVSGAFVSAGTQGSGNAGLVTMNAQTIGLAGVADIDTDTFGTGASGTVQMTATGMLLVDGTGQNAFGSPTYISSGDKYSGSGPSGFVVISAGTVALRGSASISADNTGDGNGGGVTVNAAGNLVIDGSLAAAATSAYISAQTGGAGNGGSVLVTAQNITLRNGGQIDTDDFGAGTGGDVTVHALVSLLLDGSGPQIAATYISADLGGTGNAGSVNVSAGTIGILSTATISSSVYGSGRGGDVSVTAQGALQISDPADEPFGTGVFAQTNPGSTGNAGRITVQANEIDMTTEGAISSASLGTGNAGSIALTVTGPVRLDGSVGVTSETAPGTTGAAGNIAINAGALTMSNGATIVSTDQGSGAGGNVTLTASGPVAISGAATGLSTNTSASGNAGTLTITAPSLSLSGGAEISGNTYGAGQGGNVLVTVNGPLTIDGAGAPGGGTGISSATMGAGDAGSVTVRAGSIQLLDLGGINAITDSSGNGGDVSVTATGNISISNATNIPLGAGIAAQANQGSSGNAGEVQVVADSLTIGVRRIAIQ